MAGEPGRSQPWPIGGAPRDDDRAAGELTAHAIAIPGTFGSTPHRGSYMSRFEASADTFGGSVPRGGGGIVLGSSFVAGHSAFARQASVGGRSYGGRSSHDGPHAQAPRPASPVHLGMEPGLGLTSPLLDHHHQQQQQQHRRQPSSSGASTPRQGTPHAPGASAPPTPTAGAASAADVAAALRKGRSAAAVFQNDVLYGIINAIVGIPTMISFAAIVYQDPAYKPLLGQLARISFFSAAVHQLVFTLFSTLPFAVGQPQDVGLIFLSAMATGVADIGRQVGLSDAEVVGTALLTLTVATVVVGVLTMAVAKFKLATLVQYVPLPVVGGYLGYVGYFCLAAGVGLGTSTTIDTFGSWAGLLTRDALIKFAPTITAALALWACMTRARSPWALPVTLALVPAAFHLWLLASGTTLQQAQDAGWVLKPEGKTSEQFWELYRLFNIEDLSLDGVYLPALLRQAPKMLGLFFVVTFGSCLDVAAIQADMPFPIDFNSELGTVGLSNVVVGLSGAGYTGSYIFSQTIFSMRAGVSTAAHGFVIFALEAAIFLVPYSVVQYLPNFFFGALLTVFGIEIAGDWLVRSYSKVTRAEYLLLLATFLCILQLELERGVAAGVLLCTIYFAVTYARANMAAFTVLPSRSAAVRSYQESHVLEALAGRVASVALSGFIFFGSSVLMSDKVIGLADSMLQPPPSGEDAAADGAGGEEAAQGGRQPWGQRPAKGHARAAVAPPAEEGPLAAAASGDSASSSLRDLRLASLAVTGKPLAAGVSGPPGLDKAKLAALESQAPAFIILDFRRVLGVDATAAQTLGSLVMVLRRMGVELVITRVTNRSIRRLLVAHGIVAPKDARLGGGGHGHGQGRGAGGAGGGAGDEEQPLLEGDEEGEEGAGGGGGGGGSEDGDGFGQYCRVFETLNGGAKYAEDRLLAMAQAYGLLQDSLTGLTLRQFVSMHCSEALMTAAVDVDAVAAEVAKLGLERRLGPGQRLFSFGDVPDSFFLVLKGVVVIQVKSLAAPSGFRSLPAQLDVFECERSFSSGQGAVVGITDFVLQRLRSFQADTTSECVLLEVRRPALEAMVAEVPAVATVLQAILLRDACLSEVYAYEVLERSSRA